MTTRPAATLYPFANVQGFPRIPGPVLGVDLWAGGAPFRFDPLEGVARKVLRNANFVVCGAPASGKSTFMKLLVGYLGGAYGYRVVAVDVKGEYVGLATAMGVPVLDLYPGGTTRLNLMESDGSWLGDADRLELLTVIAATRLERSLSPFEAEVLSAATARVADTVRAPVLDDLLTVLFDPSPLVDHLGVRNVDDVLERSFDLRFAFRGLAGRSQFAGMFDGATTLDVDARRGLVIDVSRSRVKDEVLHLAMLGAIRTVRRSATQFPGRNVLIADEVWRLAQLRETSRYLQSQWKLGRSDGTANGAAVHRLSELGSQGDAGSALAAAGAGLVGDSQTLVLFNQESADDAEYACTAAGLPMTATAILTGLSQGQALIVADGKASALQMQLTPLMRSITYTNAALQPSM
jgi:energy-coupling factor transporter ATP-binding protein EcfA2